MSWDKTKYKWWIVNVYIPTTLVLAPGFKCSTELHIRFEGLTLDLVLALAKLSQRYCTSFVSVQQLYVTCTCTSHIQKLHYIWFGVITKHCIAFVSFLLSKALRIFCIPLKISSKLSESLQSIHMMWLQCFYFLVFSESPFQTFVSGLWRAFKLSSFRITLKNLFLCSRAAFGSIENLSLKAIHV